MSVVYGKSVVRHPQDHRCKLVGFLSISKHNVIHRSLQRKLLIQCNVLDSDIVFSFQTIQLVMIILLTDTY